MPTDTTRPFRVGIWCDYRRFTLVGKEGIGVFVLNLVEGLLQLEIGLELYLLVRPGDEDTETVSSLRRKANGRLHVISEASGARAAQAYLERWTELLICSANRVAPSRDAVRERLRRVAARGTDVARRSADHLICRALAGDHSAVAAGALLAPAAFLAAWGAYSGWQLARATTKAGLFPLRTLLRVARRVYDAPLGRTDEPVPAAVRDAQCDAWLIPSVALGHHLPPGSVLVMHDLVHLHFPETLPPGAHDWLGKVVSARAREAALCASLPEFIRDPDVVGALGVPREKTRVVRHAPPSDFPELDEELVDRLLPPSLRRPYLLYPGSFHPYKTHRVLLEALRDLRERGEDWLDLVFTGTSQLPVDLAHLVETYKLQGAVHVVGLVSRSTLGALYRRAFATIVPSLYEQGSSPIYEALHSGCPVACSRIPSLVEQCQSMGDAMLYFDPEWPRDIVRMVLAIRADREGIRERQHLASRALLERSWKDAAGEWLAILKEAAETAGRAPAEPSTRVIGRWPRLEMKPPGPRERLDVFLFLQNPYLGGVWEATRDLLSGLVDVNRERRRLRITLGLHADQRGTETLEGWRDDLDLVRLRLDPISRDEATGMLGVLPPRIAEYPELRFCFFDCGAEAALRADAWLALVDRFPLPLLPARAHGVVVYDMIQWHVPEAFDPDFLRWVSEGMRPTLAHADRVLVTNPVTGSDAAAGYGVDPARIRCIPIAWDAGRRFGAVGPEAVPGLREPFILNPTNAAPHKGARVTLEGYARLKERLGPRTPALVLCGFDTQRFSPRYEGPLHPHWAAVRRLMSELRLGEDEDVFFLGYVSDPELVDLYRRCSVVVNAAKYDNGSFNTIEAAYFGRPAVSAWYPAAEVLRQRFEVPVRFFRVDDPQDLARALDDALVEGPATEATLERMRAHLAAPEFSVPRYAARFYDALVELAELGRRERLAGAVA